MRNIFKFYSFVIKNVFIKLFQQKIRKLKHTQNNTLYKNKRTNEIIKLTIFSFECNFMK